MTIKEMKKKLLEFEDFYGGDLIGLENVSSAKTEKDIEDLLDEHSRHLEAQAVDAESMLCEFRRELFK